MSPDLFGTVSRTQIKSDLLIFGKQLSLIHTACALSTRDKYLLLHNFFLREHIKKHSIFSFGCFVLSTFCQTSMLPFPCAEESEGASSVTFIPPTHPIFSTLKCFFSYINAVQSRFSAERKTRHVINQNKSVLTLANSSSSFMSCCSIKYLFYNLQNISYALEMATRA